MNGPGTSKRQLPKQAFEFGMSNGNLLEKGRIVAPNGPGLGIDVNWDLLATADFHVYSRHELQV